jgi:hypothetical protein
MTTVFVSGSRRLGRLTQTVERRIQNMVDQGFKILVGDANGADKAMQKYLARTGYQNVTVFCSGDTCRNNVGHWQQREIRVDSNLKGRDFYAQKDRAMASEADFGFVLWDGRSSGSVANMMELLNRRKPVVVHFSPEMRFLNLKSIDDLRELLTRCNAESYNTINKKLNLEWELAARLEHSA